MATSGDIPNKARNRSHRKKTTRNSFALRNNGSMSRASILVSVMLLAASAACARPIGTASVDPAAVQPFHRGVGLGLFASQPDYDYGHLIDEIVAHGATDLLVVVAWYQPDVTGHEIAPRAGYSPHDATVERTLRQARERGLRVSLLPIVRLANRQPDEWRGRIKPAAGLDVWFDRYRAYILRMARVAERAKIQRFGVGSELLSLERERARWLPLIRDVRAAYKGRLYYSANWDHFDPVTFWDQLDEVGVTAYFELVKDGEAPTPDLLVERWRAPREQLRALRARVGKPVFISEVGYPSKTTAARYPWDETRSAPLDHPLQATLYRAFCDAFEPAGAIDGAYFWNWFGWGGPKDGEYTPRGKPAAKVMRECFGRPWARP
jgi:hypothetical protein